MRFIGRGLVIMAVLGATAGVFYFIVPTGQQTVSTSVASPSRREVEGPSHGHRSGRQVRTHALSSYQRHSGSLGEGITGILTSMSVIALITLAVTRISGMGKRTQDLCREHVT